MRRLVAWSRSPRVRRTVRVLLGAFWTTAAVVALVVAVVVVAQQEREHETHRREATAVAVSCNRSKEYGPGIAKFFADVEKRLDLNDLSRRKLVEYRATVPKHCPPLVASRRR